MALPNRSNFSNFGERLAGVHQAQHSADEIERRLSRLQELEQKTQTQEITITGLRSDIEKLRASKPSTEGKTSLLSAEEIDQWARELEINDSGMERLAKLLSRYELSHWELDPKEMARWLLREIGGAGFYNVWEAINEVSTQGQLASVIAASPLRRSPPTGTIVPVSYNRRVLPKSPRIPGEFYFRPPKALENSRYFSGKSIALLCCGKLDRAPES